MIMKKTRLVILSLLLLSSCNESTVTIAEIKVIKEELPIYVDGTKIYGNIYSYNGKDNKPLLILSHSANMNSDSMNSYCSRAAKLGYLAYAFDYPSVSSSRSDDIERDTIFTEKDTLNGVIDYFKNQNYVSSISLFGTSQGGLVSALVANDRASDILSLSLFYPAFNIPETMVKFYGEDSDDPYIQKLKDFDVFSNIGNFEKDVLIVHGTNDFIVPYSYSQHASEIYINCELHLIEGANHGFNKENMWYFGNYDDETWSYEEAFLIKHL